MPYQLPSGLLVPNSAIPTIIRSENPAGSEGISMPYYDLASPEVQEEILQSYDLEQSWRPYFLRLETAMSIDNRHIQESFNINQYPEYLQWIAYYTMKENRFGGDYVDYHIRRWAENLPFLQEIINNIRQRPGASVFETGYGAGTTLTELIALQKQLDIKDIGGIDLQTRLLALDHVRKIRKFKRSYGHGHISDQIDYPYGLLSGNLRDFEQYGQHDVVFSHGLFEHYSEEMVPVYLNAALSMVKQDGVLIFAIPLPRAHVSEIRKNLPQLFQSVNPEHRNKGDEKDYPAKFWKYQIDQIGGELVKVGAYWDPSFGSTLRHPIDPTDCYHKGNGLIAYYVVRPHRRMYQGVQMSK